MPFAMASVSAKPDFLWNGRANIQYKKEWPRWTPPREMIQRKPELAKYENGMEPGPAKSVGCPCTLYFQGWCRYRISHPRIARMVVDRAVHVIWMRASDQSGYHRSLQSCARKSHGRGWLTAPNPLTIVSAPNDSGVLRLDRRRPMEVKSLISSVSPIVYHVSMVYDFGNISLNDLLRPLVAAEDALARLDDRVSRKGDFGDRAAAGLA